VVVEFRPIRQSPDLGNALVRFLEYFRDEQFELVKVGFEYDGACVAVEHGLNLEDGLLHLLAGHAFLLVVLDLELLGCEAEVFAHLVHDVE
jgi:hypothetical protein